MANSQIYLKEICSLEKSIYISVIRQKSESQNWGSRKTKQAKFSEKRTSLTPRYAHVKKIEHISVGWFKPSRNYELKNEKC